MSAIVHAKQFERMALKIGNFAAISAAYGHDIASCVVAEIGARIAYVLDAEVCLESQGADACLTFDSAELGRIDDELLEKLCMSVGQEPVRAGDVDILAALSICKSSELDAAKANDRFNSDAEVTGGSDWSRRYREDMQAACSLVSWMNRGALDLVWRPVRSATIPASILHYEAGLRYCDRNGALRECTREYGALQSLGLAYLVDRQFMQRILDELENDARPCLAIKISAQSLNVELLGQHYVWAGVIARLRDRPDVAARLVIEISEGCGIGSIDRVKGQIARFKRLGVALSVAGFASSEITFGHLMALHPDVVKMSPVFLHSGSMDEYHGRRLALLVNLAATMARTVVIDGVDGEQHMEIARSVGAEWVTGRSVGEHAMTRGWKLSSLASAKAVRSTGGQAANCDVRQPRQWG